MERTRPERLASHITSKTAKPWLPIWRRKKHAAYKYHEPSHGLHLLVMCSSLIGYVCLVNQQWLPDRPTTGVGRPWMHHRTRKPLKRLQTTINCFLHPSSWEKTFCRNKKHRFAPKRSKSTKLIRYNPISIHSTSHAEIRSRKSDLIQWEEMDRFDTNCSK